MFTCIVAVCGGSLRHNPYRQTSVGEGLGDAVDDYRTKSMFFDFPYKFLNESTAFNNQERDVRKPIDKVSTTSELLIGNESNIIVYAQPVHFVSTYNSDGSKNIDDKIRRYFSKSREDQVPKATRSDGHKETKNYQNPVFYPAKKSPRQGRERGRHMSKESYERRAEPAAMKYYTDLYATQKDVEMVLPKSKAIILPMVNGKPKPYDGYRSASHVNYNSYGSKGRTTYNRRYPMDEEIIYGKPRNVADRKKRAPTEYHGGIHPHFDYSDPENAARLYSQTKENIEDKGVSEKRRNPQKHRINEEKKTRSYKTFSQPNRNANKRSSEEEENDEESEEEDSKDHSIPPYKYEYDNTFVIPELKVKYYPYERHRTQKKNDNIKEGTEDDETFESFIDEYTAEYEKYKKNLPTDLEKYFGRAESEDYTVEATEKLENNSNCQKVEKHPQTAENGTDEASTLSDKGIEICYLCRDPKTGGSYEQCAYKTQPKLEKFYYGGSSSFKAKDSPEPIKYRYKRSTFEDDFDLESFILGKNANRKVRRNLEKSYNERPRKNSQIKPKFWKSGADDNDGYFGSYVKPDHHGSPSSRRNKKAESRERGVNDYERPKYTYEGPEETYEGPLHKDYYISSDHRIEDDDGLTSYEETQRKPQKKKHYDYNTYHPNRRPGPRRGKYVQEPKSEVEELEEGYRPSEGYLSDYRFGPEHFVDDEAEKERPKSENRNNEEGSKLSDQRQGSESRPSKKTDTDEETGNVKVFKNGDICRKKKVDGMICMVCRNEKTGATYEQCQYSSKPKDKYYAFGSQKSYRTANPNAESQSKNAQEDQHPEKSDVIEKKILITKMRKMFEDNSGPLGTLPNLQTGQSDLVVAPSNNRETQLNDPNNQDTDNRQVSESIMQVEPRDGIEGLDEYLYGDRDGRASNEDREYSSYEEYFRDIFPEFSHRRENPYSEESAESDEDEEEEEEEEKKSQESEQIFDPFSTIKNFKKDSPTYLEDYFTEEEGKEISESRSAEASNEKPLRLKDKRSRIPSDFFDNDGEDYHKKDIEKALGEFQSRDWSKCKKITKDKLTCYQCIDEKGVNNEECMYVEASKPIKQHLAYHERKSLEPENIQTKRNNATTASTTTTLEPPVSRRNRRPKNEKEATTQSPPQTTFGRRQVGDFRGVPRPPEEDVMTPVPSLTTEAIIEHTMETKPKWNSKRIKTLKKMIGTTERFPKRKYPVKKYIGNVRNTTDESIRATTLRPTEASEQVISTEKVKPKSE